MFSKILGSSVYRRFEDPPMHMYGCRGRTAEQKWMTMTLRGPQRYVAFGIASGTDRHMSCSCFLCLAKGGGANVRTHGRNGSRVLFLCALGRTSDWMEETRVDEGKGETYGWLRDMRACLGSFRRKYHRGAVDVTVMGVMKATGIVWKYVTWVSSSWKVCWKSPSLAPLLRQSILYLTLLSHTARNPSVRFFLLEQMTKALPDLSTGQDSAQCTSDLHAPNQS